MRVFDQTDWPDDLLAWFNSQPDERRQMWFASPLFKGLDPERVAGQLQKIMDNDDVGEAYAQAGEDQTDDDEQLTEFEELLAIQEESQAKAREAIFDQITKDLNKFYPDR